MQRRNNFVSTDTEATNLDCVFCQSKLITPYILKESTHFRLITDHAPLLEGHILIVPKNHYACYGDVPANLDAELFSLKQEVNQFFERYYVSAVYWEHGVFRQTVFHAHLHCFPFGTLTYDVNAYHSDQNIHTQNAIRDWYRTAGHYFYLEDTTNHRYLFPANMDDYMHIIKNVLGAEVAARTNGTGFRPPQQRLIEGKPMIASLIANWQVFQREVTDAQQASH
jgi:diadenosine tetraphosphate (Ap4A) HIT family hydrolase